MSIPILKMVKFHPIVSKQKMFHRLVYTILRMFFDIVFFLFTNCYCNVHISMV